MEKTLPTQVKRQLTIAYGDLYFLQMLNGHITYMSRAEGLPFHSNLMQSRVNSREKEMANLEAKIDQMGYDYSEQKYSCDRYEEKRKILYKSLKAPKGKYQVYVWQPINSLRTKPKPVGKPCRSLYDAIHRYKRKDEQVERQWAKNYPQTKCKMGHLIIDDKGNRVL